MENSSHSPVSNLTADEPSRWATAIGAGVMLVFFIEGLVGSVWIMTAVLTRRKVWNVINIFIVSLCANDLLVLSLILVLIIDSYIWGRWTAGVIMCKLNPEFTVAFTGCSLWHSALIAIHRYLVVVHNQLYKRMCKKAYVAFVLIAARAIPFACTLPGFTLDSSDYVPKLLRCILLPKEKARIIIITLVQILIPCIVVVVCYFCVFISVLRIGRRVQAAGSRAMRREIQITKMFGVIFLMIMFGFIPYSAVRNADRGNRFSADVYVIVTVCYAIGTCMSPLVYGVMSRDLRRTCCQQLRECLKRLSICPCCSRVLASIEASSSSTTNEVSTVRISLHENSIKSVGHQKQWSNGAEEAMNGQEKIFTRNAARDNAEKELKVADCNESSRLLTPLDNGKVNQAEMDSGRKESLLLFSQNSSAVDSEQAERSAGEALSNCTGSNSQMDTIENESESAAACSEMSAFV